MGTLAQEFNEAAEKLQSETNSQPQQELTQPPTQTTETKAKPKSRRRGGMFGNELTLDD